MGATQTMFFFFLCTAGDVENLSNVKTTASKLGLISASQCGGRKHFARGKALGRWPSLAKVNTSSRLFPFTMHCQTPLCERTMARDAAQRPCQSPGAAPDRSPLVGLLAAEQ